ncbi:molybdopterin-binding protein [Pigmentiphaga soli]|uniref:Molybdopterin-binding protein n=1 Tax=Pigmentiphaga soli TaxID=1007095 RepID=A0ABP8GQ39_9BURK
MTNVSPSQRRIGLFIIGDEILSGRRQDRHFAKAVELLGARGLRLSWAQFLGDDRPALVDALRRSFASGDIVFSCGGIGATPDDHTRQAAAEALGVPTVLHDEARALITRRCQESAAAGKGTADMTAPENVQRLRMGEFPAGSQIVPNPYNQIPGFFIRDHTFVPGFPVMAWPMIEWTLDQRYADLHHAVPHVEHSFLVFELAESTIAPVMEAIEVNWPGIKAFSLPSMGEHGRRHIELGVKGDPAAAALALEFLRSEVRRLGGEFAAAS